MRIPGLISLFSVLLLSVAPAALADTVLLDQAWLVDQYGAIGANGTTPAPVPLVASGAGTLTVRFTDLLWPAALQSMSFRLTTSTGQVIGAFDGVGDRTFEISGPVTLFALVFGRATAGATNPLGLGSFALRIDYRAVVPPAPVPLPAPLLLLASGLAGLSLARRRRPAGVADHKSDTDSCAPAMQV